MTKFKKGDRVRLIKEHGSQYVDAEGTAAEPSPIYSADRVPVNWDNGSPWDLPPCDHLELITDPTPLQQLTERVDALEAGAKDQGAKIDKLEKVTAPKKYEGGYTPGPYDPSEISRVLRRSMERAGVRAYSRPVYAAPGTWEMAPVISAHIPGMGRRHLLRNSLTGLYTSRAGNTYLRRLLTDVKIIVSAGTPA